LLAAALETYAVVIHRTLGMKISDAPGFFQLQTASIATFFKPGCIFEKSNPASETSDWPPPQIARCGAGNLCGCHSSHTWNEDI
jgi:hypothetical protein